MTQIEIDPNLVGAQSRSALPRAAADAAKTSRSRSSRRCRSSASGTARRPTTSSAGSRESSATSTATACPTSSRPRRPRRSAAPTAGRVYVYSTKSGRLLWSVDGKPGDQLGTGVEAAGDTNHDGVPDVIASAPGAGKAYVYSGKDGRVLLTFTAEKTSDSFGQHVVGRRRRQRRRLRRRHRRRARQRRRRRRRRPRLRLLRQGRPASC